MTDFDLTKEQQKELDDWFFENPYATHAAWLATMERIKHRDNEKNDGFYDSLKNKVFCNKKGWNVTFYIFGEQDKRMHDAYVVITHSFDIANNVMMRYHMSCIVVEQEDASRFRHMSESTKGELIEFLNKNVNILIDKING